MGNEVVCNQSAFPTLFIYTIWETCNSAIFKDKWTPIDITTNILVQKAQEYQSSPKKGKKITVKPLELDKSCPWDFFDGASQGDPPIGGAGGIIRLDETNKISFKLGLGRSTNNKHEISPLWATMKIANDKQLKRLHIYGD